MRARPHSKRLGPTHWPINSRIISTRWSRLWCSSMDSEMETKIKWRKTSHCQPSTNCSPFWKRQLRYFIQWIIMRTRNSNNFFRTMDRTVTSWEILSLGSIFSSLITSESLKPLSPTQLIPSLSYKRLEGKHQLIQKWKNGLIRDPLLLSKFQF